MYQVKKRNNDVVAFDQNKIKEAIKRTFESCNRNFQESIIEIITLKSIARAEKKIVDGILSVEDIQDSVEATLMSIGYDDVAKSYILYRKQHEKARKAKDTLLDYKKTIEGYTGKADWRVKENASIDYSLGGLILGNSGAITANYWLSEIYDEEIANAHRNCDIHLHDLSMLSGYCFTGDTKVGIVSDDGKKLDYVSFDELVKLDKKEFNIIAHTGNEDEFVITQAENPRITRYVKDLIEITIRTVFGDVKIKSTEDHPYMVEDYTYVPAKELQVGQYLVGFLPEPSANAENIIGSMSEYCPEIIDIKYIKFETDIPVYDLTVPTYHNFAIEGNIFVHNCAGWSLKTLIKEGFGGVPRKNSSKPAKHLSTICGQMVNFLGTLSLEWSGAQAFNSVDTLLAPFVKVDNLSYVEVRQCIQSLVHNLNIGSRWGCVPADTEVLTTTGFKKYNELKVSDLIYTWHDGTLEVNDVKHILIKDFSGKLQCYRGRGYDQTVTPEHHVLCKKFNKNEYMLKNSSDIFYVKTPYSLPVRFNDSALDASDLNDAQIQLAAIVYADGCLDFRNGSIHKVKIFKSERRFGNELIKACADELDLTYTVKTRRKGFSAKLNEYTFYGDSARYIVNLVGIKAKIHERFLNMSADQSKLFLETWMQFDGDSSRYMIQYDNDDIRDSLQHIALRSGCCTYLVSDLKKGNKKATNYVSIKQTDTLCPTERVEEDYSGIVWCPSVENGTAVFRRNGKVFISGQSQPVFSNFTFDWTVPDDLAELNCIVGGEELDFRYKDCKREMDMINKAFLEVMIEGDADGRSFSYPIPTYSITKDFDWDPDVQNNKLLFEMTSKFGIPYFSNYINSDLDPSSIRSMCPIHKDELVYVRYNNSPQWTIDSIENVYNNCKDSEVEVVTPSGKAVGKPTKQDNMVTYEIKLENGLSIRLGEQHIQPTKSHGTMLVKHIKVGMELPYVKNPADENLNIEFSKIVSMEVIENNDPLYCFEVTNDSHLFIMANGIITHNCRLRLDLRELRRKNGGYFGSGDNTGSIQVCTINLPRLAYKSETKEQFFSGLEHLMNICARATDIKRKVISQYLEQGLYPFTKRYLKSFDDHFSTIGLIGMNECCLNAKWIKDTIASNSGYEFAVEVLDFMRTKLSDYQEQYGCLFNLEASPAEGVTHRFAMHDKKDFPDIITAGDKTEGAPYYTNSSHLPVGYTDDIFEALDHQDDLQTKYTSGTVFHAFLGEKLPDWKSAMNLTRKIAENYKLPYFTFSPTYSICHEHGYLSGEQWKCPHCGKDTEVYSRVTGYYRAVQNFNDGKAHEFKDRKEYSVLDRKFNSTSSTTEENKPKSEPLTVSKPLLFTTSTCPNCRMARKMLDNLGFDYELVIADQDMEKAKLFDINQAPTLVVNGSSGIVKVANVSNIKKYLEDIGE